MSSPWPGGRPTSATSAASEKQPQSKTQTRPHSAVPKIQSQHTIDVSGLNLQEGDTTTTVAIGKDTYTIGKDSKNSGFRKNLKNRKQIVQFLNNLNKMPSVSKPKIILSNKTARLLWSSGQSFNQLLPPPFFPLLKVFQFFSAGQRGRQADMESIIDFRSSKTRQIDQLNGSFCSWHPFNCCYFYPREKKTKFFLCPIFSFISSPKQGQPFLLEP